MTENTPHDATEWRKLKQVCNLKGVPIPNLFMRCGNYYSQFAVSGKRIIRRLPGPTQKEALAELAGCQSARGQRLRPRRPAGLVMDHRARAGVHWPGRGSFFGYAPPAPAPHPTERSHQRRARPFFVK